MSIGLKRGAVELRQHDNSWSDLFEQEKQLLLNVFPNQVVEISHGGSTAIPGIPAKPIIDMFMAIPDLANAEHYRQKLEGLGYHYRGEEGAPGRILYAKGDEDKRTHHLNLVEKGNEQWDNHILLREYYLAHPEVAQQYADLKQSLALQYPNDRGAYGAGKKDFISNVLNKARAEFKHLI